MTATHLLIHRYEPGAGPQPGTPEHEEEMRQWADVDTRLREDGVIVAAYALQDRGNLVRRDTESEPRADGEIIFAAHAVIAQTDEAAREIARLMPTIGYGAVEVRPLMDAS